MKFNELSTEQTNEEVKKPYKILITELFKKEVVIYASNEEEAYENIDELVNKGYIDSTTDCQDYLRELFSKNVATDEDLKILEVYDKYGNKIIKEEVK